MENDQLDLLDIDANEKPKYKVYTTAAIITSIILAGPIAGGILVRTNLVRFGESNKGNVFLIFSILFFAGLVSGLILLPETVVDKIPNAVFPALYIGIMLLISKYLIGKEMTLHKERGGEFIKGWKPIVASSVVAVVAVVGIVAVGVIQLGGFDQGEFDQVFAEFQEKEADGLNFFSMTETNAIQAAEWGERNGARTWIEAIEILQKLDSVKGFNDDLKTYKRKLVSYCELRKKEIQSWCYDIRNTDPIELNDKSIKLGKEIEEVLKSISEE
ncbi:MAG: hypothetical protein JKY54_19565 [Flavobacteriales bacterium]|nr:hypothetical protein [Flavobacteriales bacterium]